MLETLLSTAHSVLPALSITQELVLVLLVTLLVTWAMKRRKYNLPPGPPSLPLIGNILDLRNQNLALKSMEWIRKYGPVVYFHKGPQPWVVMGNIEAMWEALIQRGADFSDKPRLPSSDYFSHNGMDIGFSRNDEDLKYRRKISSVAMRQFITGAQQIERNHIVVEGCINDMLAMGGPFNPRDKLYDVIFNVIHVILFGYTLKREDKAFRDIKQFFNGTLSDMTGLWEDFFPILTYFPTRKFRKLMKDCDFFVGYIQDHIKQRKAVFDENNIENLVDSMLLAMQQEEEGKNEALQAAFTDLHMAYVIVDLFFAGIDTTRSTLDWLILRIAGHQDVQQKMCDEIDAVIGNEIPSGKHRKGLIYTEAVVLETMRMYPVTPTGLPREIQYDTKLFGYDIPAKTQVVSNLLATMRDPDQYENPDVFMPERFLEPDGQKLKPRKRSFVPFGIGARNCIGDNLAKTILIYTVASFLQKLHFGPEPGKEPDFTPQNKWFFLYSKDQSIVATPRLKKSQSNGLK